MVNLLDFIKHLFRDGEMNFLRDISETTQCQQEFERIVEKRNFREQKLGCFTVKARVDLASTKRYSCPSLLALGLGIRVDLGGFQKNFFIQFSDIWLCELYNE